MKQYRIVNKGKGTLNITPVDIEEVGHEIPEIPIEKTKTSELENDGADGLNPFITGNDLPNYVPANDAEVLHKSGEEKVALKDDSARDIIISKEFDETLTAYINCAQLNLNGYTTANGYVQGTEVVCRNTSSGYRRYEKMSDDDNDWMLYTNLSGWEILPVE